MKKIVYTLLSCFFIISCGEQEVATYDVFNEQSLIQFDTNTSNLDVLVDSEGTVEIPISVSTFSSSDRRISVEIVPITDTAVESANPDQYSFEEEVIIPANELRGNLVVTGLDVGIGDDQNLVLQLKISGASFDNITIADQIHTINIKQICPISTDFLVGTYILTSPIANIWCSDPRPSFIGNGIEVEVAIGDSPNLRVFEAKYAPGSCEGFNGPYEFVIGLSCGRASLANVVTTNVSCNAGDTFIAIVNDPARVENYDVNDDSTITVNVIDDINGSCTACCGAPFTNQSFTLTKV